MSGLIMIGICGGTGCGKTTLCKAIVEKVGPEVSVISQDMYYRDLSYMSLDQRDRQNFDHPDVIARKTLNVYEAVIGKEKT